MFLAVVLAAGGVKFVTGAVLAATVCTIGRGFGSGTLGLAEAVLANAEHPTTRPVITAINNPVDRAVDRKTAARAD
jgi:hypothetical protein